MCGLAGVFGPGILKADLSAFYQLMFLNQLRGMHSTGVLRVFSEHSKRPHEIRKDVVPAQVFLNRKENDPIFTELTPVAIMGHCRHATVGNADNILGAHPFENEKYVGFHNGTLKDEEYTTKSDFFTDSEALYDHMARESVEAVLPVLREDSAFALAFYNKQDRTISFVKNKHRPLAFAVNKKRSVIYYSSEIEMLEYVLDRVGIEYESYELRDWTVATTDPLKPTFNDKEVRESKNKKIARTNLWKIKNLTPKPKKIPVVQQENYLSSAYKQSWYNELWGDTGGTTVVSTSSENVCANCNDKLVYHQGVGANIKEKNPRIIEDFGTVCPDCFDAFLNNKQVTQAGQIICN